MSEDTGNAKFVQNYNREKFLENSLFFEDFDSFPPNTNPGPGCSKHAPIKNFIK